MWEDEWINDIWRHGSSDRCEGQKKKKAKAKQMANRFEVGDIVRKQYGTKHIEITETSGSYYTYGKYLHTGLSTGRLNSSGLVKVNGDVVETDKGNGSMKGKLFKIKADGRYGMGLAINSKGEYVLEIKGTGELEAFAKKEVEVVMPFTFSVQFNGVGTDYSYLGKEGSVQVGDLLLKTDGTKGITIAKVTAVDTKSEKATKYFEGVKIKTEAIDQ